MDAYANYEHETTNRPRPPIPGRFAAELERLGRDAGTNLRLMWAPEHERVLWGKPHLVYAYKQGQRHTGWQVGPVVEVNGRLVHRPHSQGAWNAYALNPDGAHRLPNGDWVVATFDYFDVAPPRWIVEEMLDANIERPQHDANRWHYDIGTNEMVDALGPYPRGGKWAAMHVIAAHGPGICCRIANGEGRFCWGTGRDPAEEDLEEVRARVYAKLRRKRLSGQQDYEHAHTEMVRERMDQIAAHEKGRRGLYADILGNELEIELNRVRIQRQIIAPVERPRSGFKRVALLNQYGKPVAESKP